MSSCGAVSLCCEPELRAAAAGVVVGSGESCADRRQAAAAPSITFPLLNLKPTFLADVGEHGVLLCCVTVIT